MPSLSVVIPSRNAGPEFGALLANLRGQRDAAPDEIVVVDSGSEDGTPDVARARGARVISIPGEEFNHGGTRNLGIAAVRSEIAVLLVQDANPADDLALARIAAPLAADPRLAGVTGRQEPRAGASALSRWEVENHFRVIFPSAAPRTLSGAAEFHALSHEDRFRRAAFDSVFSAVRLSAWRAVPFPEAEFAEDLAWAKEALLAGFALAFAPEARVYHSHERTAAYNLKRSYLFAINQAAILEFPPEDFTEGEAPLLAGLWARVKDEPRLLDLRDPAPAALSHFLSRYKGAAPSPRAANEFDHTFRHILAGIGGTEPEDLRPQVFARYAGTLLGRYAHAARARTGGQPHPGLGALHAVLRAGV